jgi:Bacterial protein of unknown function (DUF885)
MRTTTLAICLTLTLACAAPPERAAVGEGERLVADYVERYLEVFPTAAVEAGRHDYDAVLEDLSSARLAEWLTFNRTTLQAIESLNASDLGDEDRLDLELVERRARLAVFDFDVMDRPRADPLFWTSRIGDATVFLLVRDDAPREQRVRGAVARALALPHLAGQARAALDGSRTLVAPEVAAIAARQVRASARFYGEGLAGAADGLDEELRGAAAEAGAAAGAALTELADFLDVLATEAAGSPRLGDRYAERFALATGETAPLAEVLERARAALADKTRETAEYGRRVWPAILPGETPPAGDDELIRRLFHRIGDDHAATVEEFVGDYESLLAGAVDFVRGHDLMTLPEPLTVHTARSPSFFVGQSVGGVYPAGPWAPNDAETLFFLPTPADDVTAEQRDAFFRDFNHHFNVMITPHEMIPGHYVQLKLAARHPRKVRALFADGVYVEGWGTFCERLMLDLGWGGPADRVAHLKKQLENIARTIVDIRVHTEGMTRDEVIDFVQGEAFQEAQFAANMWTRAITSSPQLTSYFLGYESVRRLYDDVRAARGDAFDLREFMDGMMELGPVPVARYREHMLAAR